MLFAITFVGGFDDLAFDDISVFRLDLAERERGLDLGDCFSRRLFVDHDHVAAKLQN